MIRISGGQWRGRNLVVPAGKTTRPTSSMVREAVFGMLQGRMDGASVLDLFCGSGAYAFEALSRGAKSAVLVDSDEHAIAAARRNAQMLQLDALRVYKNDFRRAVQIMMKNDEKFDIIFLDPPYASGLYQTAINESKTVMNRGGCIVCEHASSISLDCTDDFEIEKQKRYGIRAVTIFVGRNPVDRDISGQL